MWPEYKSNPNHDNMPVMILGEYRNVTVDHFEERMKFWNDDIRHIKHMCHKMPGNTNTGNFSAINSGFG